MIVTSLKTKFLTRNQAVIQDGRMDIQSKNVGYARNGNMDAERSNMNQATNVGRNGLLEELNASVIMIARIQPTNNKSDAELTYAKVISKDNSGQDEHDLNTHDQPYADVDSLIYNVQVEAENQHKMNNELKK
ncbi:hypothetical protein Tco_0093769 [Tanacetum coccineum]